MLKGAPSFSGCGNGIQLQGTAAGHNNFTEQFDVRRSDVWSSNPSFLFILCAISVRKQQNS